MIRSGFAHLKGMTTLLPLALLSLMSGPAEAFDVSIKGLIFERALEFINQRDPVKILSVTINGRPECTFRPYVVSDPSMPADVQALPGVMVGPGNMIEWYSDDPDVQDVLHDTDSSAIQMPEMKMGDAIFVIIPELIVVGTGPCGVAIVEIVANTNFGPVTMPRN